MVTKQRANYYLKTKQLVGKNSSFETRKAKDDLTPTKKQFIENHGQFETWRGRKPRPQSGASIRRWGGRPFEIALLPIIVLIILLPNAIITVIIITITITITTVIVITVTISIIVIVIIMTIIT